MVNLVQPILVVDTGTHEDTVRAAAEASLEIYRRTNSSYEDSWKEWLSGMFTKTVRRINEKEFYKLTADPSLLEFPSVYVGSNSGKAIALPPIGYSPDGNSLFPKPVKKAQVQGTNFPKSEENVKVWDTAFDLTNLIVVNGDLSMTTGKESAQVAHGAWKMNLMTDFSYPYYRIIRVSDDLFQQMKTDSSAVITDSGLTEFSGPTETVLIRIV